MNAAKAELRRAIKERLERMSENDRRVESQILMRELTKLITPAFTTIAVYLPFKDEPDIRMLITELLHQKNMICMPNLESNHLRMRPIEALDDVHLNRTTGIPEPLTLEPLDESTIDLVLVPGRAFSPTGVRLGRGSGGYDHWIHEQRIRNPKTLFLGLCFDCQMTFDIPTEAHDEKVDSVLTPSKLHKKE